MFRDVNVTKYRKLLYSIQEYCKQRKESANLTACIKKSPLTDFERGVIQGKHAAYNDILKTVHDMIRHAESDWNYMHCRERSCDIGWN